MTLNFTFPCAYLVSASHCEETSVSFLLVFVNNHLNVSGCLFLFLEAYLSISRPAWQAEKKKTQFRLKNSLELVL